MNYASGAPAIVVTGASSGVGREIARLAAEDCIPLVLVGRSETALCELTHELYAQRRGLQIHALSLDLQHDNALDQITAVLSTHGLYCDILVNSAGFGVFGPVVEADKTLQLQLIDVNIKAMVALTLRFLPGMISRGRGGVINLSSITAYAPGPYMACYCASKAFVRSFSAALSAEVAGTGVTVTCLAAGVLRTAFFDRKPMARSRMMKILPRGDAVRAARTAWTAFKRGKSFTMPRFIDYFTIGVCWFVPDQLLARLILALQRTH